MEVSLGLLFALLLLLSQEDLCKGLRRHDFPSNFVFGAGTSAFQYEGAPAEDGRTPSIMDHMPGFQPEKSMAIVAADGYHKYKEDVKLMSDTGLEAYKFSISWSRLLPSGRGTVNDKGIKYYNNVLDELARQGIPAYVTLNHLDLPQALQDEYGGWLSPKIVEDFKAFADVCFEEFGQKVSHWTTMDEPNINGFSGVLPYYRCYEFGNSICKDVNPTNVEYVFIHNMLIAHSEVVKLYKTKYQNQSGWIGLNVYTFWCQPFSNSSADVEATQRVNSFMFGWILNPIVNGDYPELMKKIAGTRLPSFTKSESEVLKGSFDFIGLNYYTAVYISDNSSSSKVSVHGFREDVAAIIRVDKAGLPTEDPFLPIHVPSDFSGLHKMLRCVKEKYGNHPIYIQENGFATGPGNALNDTARVVYLKGYIGSMLEAIRNGVDVRGYFVWSFVDVFEFLGGYTYGFGLYHVDFNDLDRRRTPKFSARWYSRFLKGGRILRVVFC
ncbi:hypothetical protein HPP92_002728 [Vanilla planifolia]|uniref:Beta-glucosidase n=1 Tax=Vanilla planifolia TaxID=51239 RepID=A0A835S2B4_VANPL|nr:hypothetical protein HPP92_002728 [Vanilla planifolia]